MSFAEKFAIKRPSGRKLKELGEMVDELEDMIHAGMDFREKLAELNVQIAFPVTAEDICEYHSSQSRTEFLRCHLTPDPHTFRDLSDEEMLWLIEQMQKDENLSKEHLRYHYSRILEINASVPCGTLHDLESFGNMDQPAEILRELKGSKRVFHL